MHKINPFKAVAFCLLFLACTSLFAEKTKSLSHEDVFDYTTCAAFFAVIAGGMEAGTNASKQFTRMSEKMNDYAISLPSDSSFMPPRRIMGTSRPLQMSIILFIGICLVPCCAPVTRARYPF